MYERRKQVMDEVIQAMSQTTAAVQWWTPRTIRAAKIMALLGAVAGLIESFQTIEGWFGIGPHAALRIGLQVTSLTPEQAPSGRMTYLLSATYRKTGAGPVHRCNFEVWSGAERLRLDQLTPSFSIADGTVENAAFFSFLGLPVSAMLIPKIQVSLMCDNAASAAVSVDLRRPRPL
jgi:hypothetical protein